MKGSTMDKTLHDIKQAEEESAKRIANAKKAAEQRLRKNKEELAKEELEAEEQFRIATEQRISELEAEMAKRHSALKATTKKQLARLDERAKKGQAKAVTFIIKRFEEELR